jgi:biotin carboxylase
MTGELPRICLLVGGHGSLSLAEAAAAARGIAEPVLLLDRTEVAGSPALHAVAESVAQTAIVDTSDPDEVSGAVALWRASAVAAFVDAYCPVADEIKARVFGLTVPPGRWRKDTQRALLLRHGVTAMTSSLVSTPAELSAAVARHGLPVVVKPARGVSSRDIWRLTDPLDLDAFRASVPLDGGRELVVEPYLADPAASRGPHRANYLSVELFVTTTATSAFITDRRPLAEPCRETGLIGPTNLDPATRRAVLGKADQARRALGLDPGSYHIEIKLTDGGPEILEVNGRLGGYVRRLVWSGTGTDVGRAAIMAALDRPVRLRLDWRQHVAALHLQAPAATARIEAAPRGREIRRLPGVLAVEHVSPAGTPADWRNGTEAACAKLWVGGADEDELHRKLAGCVAWLSDEFDFRDASGRRVRDEEPAQARGQSA